MLRNIASTKESNVPHLSSAAAAASADAMYDAKVRIFNGQAAASWAWYGAAGAAAAAAAAASSTTSPHHLTPTSTASQQQPQQQGYVKDEKPSSIIGNVKFFLSSSSCISFSPINLATTDWRRERNVRN